MKKLIFILILFLFCNLHSYSNAVRFSSFQTQAYIPYSNINDIREDSYGLIWIATEHGLIKFNGYQYFQYQQTKETHNSLSNNNCRKIIVDSRNQLWIGTDNGLNLYDREKDSFKRFTYCELTSNNFLNLAEDNDGFIWAVTFRELVKISATDGTLIESYPYPNATCMYLDRDNIWLGSLSNGLHRFSMKTKKIEPIKIHNLPSGENELHVSRILRVSTGQLFIGTRDLGLVIYDPETGEMENHSSITDSNYFKSDYIISIYEDSKGRVWIGAVNGNLTEYELDKKKLLVPSFRLPAGTEQLTISCTMEDSKHNLWVGTHHYWLYQSCHNVENFNFYQKEPSINSLSHNAVTCFADNADKLLIGTDGGGLNVMDKKTGKFSVDNRFGKIILDIKKGNQKDEFWIATWGDNKENVSLVQFNLSTGAFKNYPYLPNNSESIPTNCLRSVLVDNNYVWVSTDGAGIFRIDSHTGKIESRNNSSEPIFSDKNPQWVNHIMKDNKGRLWFCTSEGVLLYKDKECHRIDTEDLTDENLQNEMRMSIQTADGKIYFVTTNNGLFRYNEEANHLDNVTQDYHLPQTLVSICEDIANDLWVATTNEIIKIEKSSGNTHHYNFKNDLNGNSFTSNAIYKSDDIIYIGSNNGFFSFKVSELKYTKAINNIYLNDLYLWGVRQEVSDSSCLKKALTFTDTIILDHHDNNISIDYYCINYENAEHLNFSYKLTGYQDKWANVGQSKRVYFTNLSPGTYKFQAKVTTNNACQEYYTKPLTIIISSPWWSTWWFRILSVVLIILIFLLFLYLRERELRKKQVELESLVKERTAELHIKNQEIQKQKENLEIHNKRLNESLDTKNKILSVLAHDLRNPLTAIVGNLTLMNDEKKNEDPKISQVCKSAKNLQTQMENLLDWARIQNQTIFYSPQDTFMDFVSKESITLLQELVNDKNINLIYINKSKTSAYIDQRMISTVCRNLINNAIKFTNKGGKIEIRLEETEHQISWSIRDNGVGMTEEQRLKLFDKNATSTTFGTQNEKGSGLGLKICQEFIAINHGTFNIESQKGEGTYIQILLPKGTIQQESKQEESCLTIDKQETVVTDKKQHLLIVDDSEEILSYICEIFRPYYHIESATDGEMALLLAKKSIPDLIISDVIMPKMNGKELCHNIKQDMLTRHIPVIMLTSEDSIDDQIEGLTIGADDYLTKPFNAEILKAKVSTILKNKELQREHLRNKVLRMPDIEIPESNDDAFISNISKVIKENISNEELTVEFLASETALSRVQLFRKMKAITGCSPSEYIKAIRLEYAAEILEHSKQSIAEIAYAVGFSDPKYFSSCFSDKFGITPSQYAKEKHADKEKE